MNDSGRQKKFQQELERQELDGFLVTHPANLRYLCGYTGSNGLLLFLGGRRTFFTDGRYTAQARAEVAGARVVIAKGPLLNDAVGMINRLRSAAIGFEADHTTVDAAAPMGTMVHRRIRWRPTAGLIQRLRMVKDAAEIQLIRKAVNLGAEVYRQALAVLRPGVKESEVAGVLEFAARRAGADGMSFDTIVAGGKRSALPHGRASNQVLPRRGFVVLDSGVIRQGYCSDMTRTVHLGATRRWEREWYKSVLEAQLAAISTALPGILAGEVDQAARKVLKKAKLDRFFTHSTGHGVGLEIHEPSRLGKGQMERLEPGMVITVEPGIYVPGKGGIRIEDMLLITETGYEVLTPVGKEVVEI